MSLSTHWIPPEEIKAVDQRFNFLFCDLPEDAEKARRKIENLISATQKTMIEKDYCRYNDLRRYGQKAVSKHDIEICNNGNAKRALFCCLELKTNHIIYAKTIIRDCNLYLSGDMEIEGKNIQLGFDF